MKLINYKLDKNLVVKLEISSREELAALIALLDEYKVDCEELKQKLALANRKANGYETKRN